MSGTGFEAHPAQGAPGGGAGGVWHRIGRQLAHPRGAAGRLVGRLMARVNRAPYRLALEALAPAATDRVLEVGFGPGEGLQALARQVPDGEIHGIEGSAEMLRQAARRNAGTLACGRMTLLEGDFRHLPWPDATFDKVLAVNVAYFFDAEGRAMAEIRRVLRPGGRVVLYVTDRETMARWPFAGSDTHVTYDAHGLGELLGRCGFAQVVVRAARLPLGVGGLVAVAVRGGG